MKNKTLIIVSGPPCTGKTTLSNKVAEKFDLPLVSKDYIKESLFKSLGIKDRDWSRQLGIASFELIYSFAESIMRAANSLVVEGNFKEEYSTEPFRNLIAKYDFTPFQIQCKTEGKVLFERFKQRSESGLRHPGHVDHLTYSEMEEDLLKGSYEPLNIGGDVVDIDTTDFTKIDYDDLFKRIQNLM